MLPRVALPQITHWIKGRTAREANLLLERTGEPFWQDESYYHWVRNGKEFHRIVAYIEENPVSAGLAAKPEDWPWSSAAEQAKACLLLCRPGFDNSFPWWIDYIRGANPKPLQCSQSRNERVRKGVWLASWTDLMLQRIISIRNVGRFKNCAAIGDVTFLIEMIRCSIKSVH